MVSEHLTEISSASGHETGEGRAAGGLTDRLVAKVKAPPDIVTEIVERTVLGQSVKQDGATCPDFKGHNLLCKY